MNKKAGLEDALGVKTGDTAGIFFCGEMEEEVSAPRRKWLDLEMMQQDFEVPEGGDETAKPRLRSEQHVASLSSIQSFTR